VAKLEAESLVWWCTYIIPALGRLKEEALKFEASLGYTMRLQDTLKKYN
jgi:hypothetical protein